MRQLQDWDHAYQASRRRPLFQIEEDSIETEEHKTDGSAEPNIAGMFNSMPVYEDLE